MYSQISFETLREIAAIQAQQTRELITASEQARLANLSWLERTLKLVSISLMDLGVKVLGILVGILLIYVAIRTVS
ncbi:MAG: hypothetical protein QXT45_07045 [Candidatus Bilamarchaeaceae archaeon]